MFFENWNLLNVEIEKNVWLKCRNLLTYKLLCAFFKNFFSEIEYEH